MTKPKRPELVLLGRVLGDLRLRSKLSQGDVAKVLGVARWTICQWEQGKRAPQLDDLCRLAALYSVSVGELFGTALDAWIPPTLELVEVDGATTIRRTNGRKKHAA